jgi:predicted nucleic acid-binding protein
VIMVANAGPLIALGRIKQLDLLPTLYGEVVVPPAVYQEVTREADLPGAQELVEAVWLRVAELNDQTAVQRLLFWLDLGESEAIILAQELEATLLMDERRGRTIASTLGLSITGTAGVLLAAKKIGQIEAVTPLLDTLLAAGIRLSPRLYEEVQRLAGEI